MQKRFLGKTELSCYTEIEKQLRVLRKDLENWNKQYFSHARKFKNYQPIITPFKRPQITDCSSVLQKQMLYHVFRENIGILAFLIARFAFFFKTSTIFISF